MGGSGSGGEQKPAFDPAKFEARAKLADIRSSTMRQIISLSLVLAAYPVGLKAFFQLGDPAGQPHFWWYLTSAWQCAAVALGAALFFRVFVSGWVAYDPQNPRLLGDLNPRKRPRRLFYNGVRDVALTVFFFLSVGAFLAAGLLSIKATFIAVSDFPLATSGP